MQDVVYHRVLSESIAGKAWQLCPTFLSKTLMETKIRFFPHVRFHVHTEGDSMGI